MSFYILCAFRRWLYIWVFYKFINFYNLFITSSSLIFIFGDGYVLFIFCLNLFGLFIFFISISSCSNFYIDNFIEFYKTIIRKIFQMLLRFIIYLYYLLERFKDIYLFSLFIKKHAKEPYFIFSLYIYK